MTHYYNITGMTCNNCVARVKSELLKLGDVSDAQIQLNAPQATITMQKHIAVSTLQEAVNKVGHYTIAEAGTLMHSHEETDENKKSWLATYRPVLLIFLYITAISFISAATSTGIHWMRWMQIFMGGFFIAFSFFKFLDLKGFAESYAMYDVIAKRIPAWGYIYAFIELILGLSYAANLNPPVINGITFIIMSVSLAGVLQSVLNKRKIKCACLGAVFNLPMSTVTIVEDAAMIVMSGIMMISVL